MIDLCKRHKQVIQGIAKGWSYKRIGYELGISDKSVSVHVFNVRNILGARSNGQLVAMAIALGLVPIPDKETILERLKENENRNRN